MVAQGHRGAGVSPPDLNAGAAFSIDLKAFARFMDGFDLCAWGDRRLAGHFELQHRLVIEGNRHLTFVAGLRLDRAASQDGASACGFSSMASFSGAVAG